MMEVSLRKPRRSPVVELPDFKG